MVGYHGQARGYHDRLRDALLSFRLKILPISFGPDDFRDGQSAVFWDLHLEIIEDLVNNGSWR